MKTKKNDNCGINYYGYTCINAVNELNKIFKTYWRYCNNNDLCVYSVGTCVLNDSMSSSEYIVVIRALIDKSGDVKYKLKIIIEMLCTDASDQTFRYEHNYE